MKLLTKTTFIAYITLLLWLVLFKFSYDIVGVVQTYQTRSLNLLPFAGHLREMIDNLVVFVPFGLLLGVNFKQLTFWQRMAIIVSFSLGVEVAQYVLAIGVTDITDVIMNTLGGLIGVGAYALGSKYIDTKKLDVAIAIVGLLIVVLFLWLRLFVFRVNY